GGADVRRHRVAADDARPEPGHRLGDQPAAAAEIDQAQPLERPAGERVAAEMAHQPTAQIAEPGRIEVVKRAELAVRVPPLVRERLESSRLFRVQGGATPVVPGPHRMHLRSPPGRSELAPAVAERICYARPQGATGGRLQAPVRDGPARGAVHPKDTD